MGQCFPNKDKKVLKVLILGISGCGKSTFIRQLRFIHKDIFTEIELLGYVEIIRNNIIIGMKELIQFAEEIDYYDNINEDLRRNMRFIKETDENEIDFIKHSSKFIDIWKDNAIQEIFEKGHRRQMQMGNLSYFMDEEIYNTIIQKDYVPSTDDIIRSRQRTTGSYTTDLKIDKYNWQFIDVGGQTPERSKWKNIVSDGIKAVIYFTAMNEYNTISTEEEGLTKMQISLRIWRDICNDEEIFGDHMILFLNKQDLFEKKFNSRKGKKEFKNMYPDFLDFYEEYCSFVGYDEAFNSLSKKEKELEAATEYLITLFKEDIIYDENNENNEIPVFITCAIDPSIMKDIFLEVKYRIFTDRISQSGMF